MTRKLETDRLKLRPAAPQDAEAYALGIGDFAVARNLTPVDYPYTLDMARTYLAKEAARGPENVFLIIDCRVNGLVGAISLQTELGYWIARPHWGRGMATEAAICLLSWHFAKPDAPSVMSSAMLDNKASQRVQEKLGFIETGRSMRHAKPRGQMIEHIDTRLDRAAFFEKGFMS